MQLAKEAGITTRFLYYLARGERNASSPLARRLATLTGTEPEVWVFGSPEERRSALKKIKAQRKGKA